MPGMTTIADQSARAVFASGPVPAADAASKGPRRLLIVSDAWWPQVNGVVRTYENICRALEAEGCTVRVVGPSEFLHVALPFYREISLALFPWRKLDREIRAFAPESVHIAVEGPLGWAARRWCLKKRVPFSTAFHTNFPAYLAVRVPHLLRRPVKALAIRVVRRFHDPAKFTYVATGSVEAELRGWGFATRIVRLSRGVDLDLFHPGNVRRIGRDAPVLLYVGRVAAEKNVEEFLALDCQGRKVVVGDGPLLATLSTRYPEADFRGALTGTALADAYRTADVLVFPSLTDTFGLVIIEALASGVPVAAHDAPGPRDIIAGDARLGAIDADLGRAIARALAAPGSPEERHAAVRERFSWADVAHRFRRHSTELRP